MKARIKKKNGLWVGQVYHSKWGWETVTYACLTKIGARLELSVWKRDNCPEEFDL